MARKRGTPHGRAVSKTKRFAAPPKAPVTLGGPAPAENEDRSPAPEPAAAPANRMGSAPRSVLRTSSFARPMRRSAPGLSTDYHYVISDLKRIAILAGGTFVVLIGLAFVVK